MKSQSVWRDAFSVQLCENTVSKRGMSLRNICLWLYIVVNMQEVECSSTEFRDIEFEPMLIYL